MAVDGTFSAVGVSGAQVVNSLGDLSLNFSGTGTVSLERSFDGGTTWNKVAEYTESTEKVVRPGSPGQMYRLNCTVYAAEVAYRLG